MSFRDLGEVLLFTTTATIVKSWSKVNVRPNEKKSRERCQERQFSIRGGWKGDNRLIPNSIHVSSGLMHLLNWNFPKHLVFTKQFVQFFWKFQGNIPSQHNTVNTLLQKARKFKMPYGSFATCHGYFCNLTLMSMQHINFCGLPLIWTFEKNIVEHFLNFRNWRIEHFDTNGNWRYWTIGQIKLLRSIEMVETIVVYAITQYH